MKEHMRFLENMSQADVEEYFDRERDNEFLNFAAMVQIGADAIREKRRLQECLFAAEADRDKWMKVAQDGSGAIIPVDIDIIDIDHFTALIRLFIDIHRNAWTMRRYPERTRSYLCDTPLSGLFPGPVIDGGRRLWDHNPNCRERAMVRYYAGFEGEELRVMFDAAERSKR